MYGKSLQKMATRLLQQKLIPMVMTVSPAFLPVQPTFTPQIYNGLRVNNNNDYSSIIKANPQQILHIQNHYTTEKKHIN